MAALVGRGSVSRVQPGASYERRWWLSRSIKKFCGAEIPGQVGGDQGWRWRVET